MSKYLPPLIFLEHPNPYSCPRNLLSTLLQPCFQVPPIRKIKAASDRQRPNSNVLWFRNIIITDKPISLTHFHTQTLSFSLSVSISPGRFCLFRRRPITTTLLTLSPPLCIRLREDKISHQVKNDGVVVLGAVLGTLGALQGREVILQELQNLEGCGAS